MRKITLLFFFIISVYIIVNSIISIVTQLRKKELLIEAQKELNLQISENKRLEKDLVWVSDPSFIEREARDKLFMEKPGESTLVLPATAISPTPIQVGQKKEGKSWWESLMERIHL